MLTAKKWIPTILSFVIMLSGCGTMPKDSAERIRNESAEIRGIWVSYSEVNTLLKNGKLKKNFAKLLQDGKTLGVTDLFLHVRAFCDAIYPSDYFPMTESAAAYDYDILSYMVSAAHRKNIRIHGWLNPYRVRTGDAEIEKLPEKSPARVFLSDQDPENDGAVCFCNGIYLNPASSAARQLILNGIRELLTRYDLDGIHLDDYFYPTTAEDFDAAAYNDYVSGCETPLSLADWRCANVNALVSGCYTAVKFSGHDRIFSISPAASITKNREDLYADAEAWCESGCVDWLIPQLYFGFHYPLEEYRFETLLKAWQNLTAKTSAKLLIGLAPYKIGAEAEADRPEWTDGSDDLLARQVTALRQEKAAGFVFFSYSALFSENARNTAERENLFRIL